MYDSYLVSFSKYQSVQLAALYQPRVLVQNLPCIIIIIMSVRYHSRGTLAAPVGCQGGTADRGRFRVVK